MNGTGAGEHGVAGASARFEAQRLESPELAWRQDLIRRRPFLGRLRVGLAGRVTVGDNWNKGALGEEKLGASLDTLEVEGCLVIHDRRRPPTKANIDHLVVAASGVWVIDAKRYRGKVVRVDKGGWLRSDVRVTVNGQDRTKLAIGVDKQVAAVERVLGANGFAGVPVHGVLCFVDGQWPIPARTFEVAGVIVGWGRVIKKMIRKPGPVRPEDRARICETILVAFPSAVAVETPPPTALAGAQGRS